MKLSVICFTRNGYELMNKFNSEGFELFCKCSALEDECSCSYVSKPVDVWAGEQFSKSRAILFIGAAGIAVRAIADSVKNKLSDSPVLVMDDNARFVIPILSGHVGGANELAEMVSELTGAVPVITTATDVNDRFAVDSFAKKNDLSIVNKEGIAKVSSKILDRQVITVAIDEELTAKADVYIGKKPENVSAELYLEPKDVVLGIGCRRGKTASEIREFVLKELEEAKIKAERISCIASIDVKKDEEGLIEFAESLRVPFVTYTAEELNAIEGEFSDSEFVKSKVGTGCVSERAAVLASKEGRLVLKKIKGDGVTLAAAIRKWRLFDE